MLELIDRIKSKYLSIPLPMRVAILYMFCNVIQKGVAFVAVPIYTRIISSEQYGFYSVFLSWENILSIFATLNMWNYVFSKGMIKYESNRDGFISSLIGLSCLTTIGMFIIYFPLRTKFESFSGLSFTVMSRMFILFVFYPAFEYWCARKKFEYKIGKYVMLSVLISIITPILSIFLISVFKNNNISNTGIALIDGKILCPILIYIIIFINLLKKNHKVFDREIWTYALRFSLPLIPHFLSSIVLQQSDRIMIAHICGNSDAGIYSVAYSAASILLIVNSALMNTIIPWTYNKMKSNSYNGIANVGTFILLFIAIVNLGMSLFAPEMIAVMAPDEYKKAIYIIPPVAITNVFICMFNLYVNIEYYFEETKFVMIASVLSAIANIILNAICIPMFGFIAAGYTTVVCYVIYAFCHYLFMKLILKKHNIEFKIYSSVQMWSIALLSMFFAIGITVIYANIFLRIVIAFLIVILLYINKKKILSIYIKIKTEAN